MGFLRRICKYFICAPVDNQGIAQRRGKRSSRKSKSKDTVYFRDGKRKIDAILIYDASKESEQRKRFFKNLGKVSLDIEKETSSLNPSIMYVKVHGSEKVLQNNAKLYGLPVKYNQLTVVPEDQIAFYRMKNMLNDPNPDPEHPIAKRAWETISKKKSTKLTNCERSAIIFMMMNYIPFGEDDEPFKIGLQHLLIKGEFITAYPLHDGPWQWPVNSVAPLNDRQLLVKYWANYDQLMTQQPYTTIENYCGPEIAMYFAWLGYYNKMLLIAAIMGLLPYIAGILHVLLDRPDSINEVCSSDAYICPSCKQCEPNQLKDLCPEFIFAYAHDHASIVLFSCGMAFWAQAFMECWKRRQNILILKWNLDTAIDDQVRPEFQATATGVRLHKYTGEMEQYVPLRTKIFAYTMSISVVSFMMLLVVATTFLTIMIEGFVTTLEVPDLITDCISSLVTLAVMITFRYFYGSIATRLTMHENPRTPSDFDKSYMIKMVVFSLVNNYGGLMYSAFFKGKFFTYPGDEYVRLSYFPVSAESCSPPNCVSEVAILLGFITIFMPIISNVVEVLIPMVTVWFKAGKARGKQPPITTERYSWEKDFELKAKFDCMDEIEEMVLQYGFVTLFVAAFPLAPFLALCNNVFEVRIDSTKLLKYHRRPVGIYRTSVRVWFDTLQFLTYFAIVTNALYISFTTNFIPSMIYYLYYDKNYKGFYFFLLSKYKVVDNYWTAANITECYYNGQRYPPGHPKQYKLTDTHYIILSSKLAFAIIFVILVLFVTAIISYAIPDIPSGIQDLLAYNARKERLKNER